MFTIPKWVVYDIVIPTLLEFGVASVGAVHWAKDTTVASEGAAEAADGVADGPSKAVHRATVSLVTVPIILEAQVK